MRRVVSIALITLMMSAAAAPAGIVDLEEEFDDQKAVETVMAHGQISSHKAKLDALREQLILLRERDMLALFGDPVEKPEKAYTLPVVQPRTLVLSDFRYADETQNKNHVEFHEAGDVGAVQIYYGVDGISPEAVVVYLRVNDGFATITDDASRECIRQPRAEARNSDGPCGQQYDPEQQ